MSPCCGDACECKQYGVNALHVLFKDWLLVSLCFLVVLLCCYMYCCLCCRHICSRFVVVIIVVLELNLDRLLKDKTVAVTSSMLEPNCKFIFNHVIKQRLYILTKGMLFEVDETTEWSLSNLIISFIEIHLLYCAGCLKIYILTRRGGVTTWVARLTRNAEVLCSSPIKGPRCFLEQ